MIPQHNASGVEEIIVTARRRAEDLKRTPIAITALNAADLQATRVGGRAGAQHIERNVLRMRCPTLRPSA